MPLSRHAGRVRAQLIVTLGRGFWAQPHMSAAHPLPSIQITASYDSGSVNLSITVPLDELNRSLPQAAGFGMALQQGLVDAAAMDQLSDYFAEYRDLATADKAVLQPRLISATIDQAAQDEGSIYDVRVLELTVSLAPGQEIYPLTLS